MELLRCLGSLIEPPSDETARLATLLDITPAPEPSDHTDLFAFQLYPLASVYLDNQGKIGGEARDRIAGFWRALDLIPPSEPDHLTVMLAFYSEIRDRQAESSPEDGERWQHVRQAFLWEHLLSWMPAYIDKVRSLDRSFYRGWAEILKQALAEEASACDRPGQLPLHLRQAEGMVDPRESPAETFLESLLSPARSGLILVRSDLERAGRELDLGVRKGERRYVLKALLGQDDAATLRWLAAEASRTAEQHLLWEPITGDIALFWSERATRTSSLLTDLATDLGS